MSSRSVHRGDAVLKGSHQTVPAHLVGDVIPVSKEYNTDPKGDPVLSLDHYIGAPIVLQTIPFSDDESPNINPNLLKK